MTTCDFRDLDNYLLDWQTSYVQIKVVIEVGSENYLFPSIDDHKTLFWNNKPDRAWLQFSKPSLLYIITWMHSDNRKT